MTQGPSLALTTFQGSVPFPEPLPRDPCLIAFPSFLPDYLWVFLTVLVIQTISANFQLVFNENCSMFRCILDVYVAGDEFHILLLHHPDLLPIPCMISEEKSDVIVISNPQYVR